MHLRVATRHWKSWVIWLASGTIARWIVLIGWSLIRKLSVNISLLLRHKTRSLEH